MVTVDVFTMAYNEEKVLPHFIKHYKQFCRNITLYNNCSTDSTVQICKDNNVKVIDTGLDEINDLEFLRIKENCYLSSDADYVIVVDPDEFVYHPDMTKLLEEYKLKNITIPKTRGYTMATNDGYPNNGFLVDKIKTGIISIDYAKRSLFSPKLKIHWHAGMHRIISLEGPAKESEQQDISILHYKFIDRKEIHDKKIVYAKRMSQFNKKNSLGTYYYNYDRDETEKWFQDHVDRAITVI